MSFNLGLIQDMVKGISSQVKEHGRERVPLPQASMSSEVATIFPINIDTNFTPPDRAHNSVPYLRIEAFSSQDFFDKLPFDAVISFLEVNFEKHPLFLFNLDIMNNLMQHNCTIQNVSSLGEGSLYSTNQLICQVC